MASVINDKEGVGGLWVLRRDCQMCRCRYGGVRARVDLISKHYFLLWSTDSRSCLTEIGIKPHFDSAVFFPWMHHGGKPWVRDNNVDIQLGTLFCLLKCESKGAIRTG